MKNVLFVSSYPFPLNKGSNQHSYFYLTELCKKHNVYCIFFIQKDNQSSSYLQDFKKKIKIKNYSFLYFKEKKFRGKIISKFLRIFSFPNYYMELATHKNGVAEINRFIKLYKINIIHIEHFHYAKYLMKISSKIKKVIVYHDLYHSIPFQKSRFEKNLLRKILLLIESLKLYFFQKLIDSKIDIKIFLNEKEMSKLPKNSFLIPHTANANIGFHFPKVTDTFNLLFIGTYLHPPNVNSVEYLIKEIVPRLILTKKSFKLNIVGHHASRFEKLINKKNLGKYIKIHGFFDDLDILFQNMDIATFPILYGGGIKTKILDSMAGGLPVITTTVGIEGITSLPLECIAIGDTPDKFVEKIILLMEYYSIRVSMATKSHEFINDYYSSTKSSIKLLKLYDSI